MIEARWRVGVCDRFRENLSSWPIFQSDGDGSCLAGVAYFHHVEFLCSLSLSVSRSSSLSPVFLICSFLSLLLSSLSFRSRHVPVSLLLPCTHTHTHTPALLRTTAGMTRNVPWRSDWSESNSIPNEFILPHSGSDGPYGTDFRLNVCVSSWRFTVSHHILFLSFPFSRFFSPHYADAVLYLLCRATATIRVMKKTLSDSKISQAWTLMKFHWNPSRKNGGK